MIQATTQPPAPVTPLIEARDIRVSAAQVKTALRIDLTVDPGQLHIIHSRDPMQSSAIADVLLGVSGSESAFVQFMGHAWGNIVSDQANYLRRRVGRVRARGNWMRTRSLMHDILLPSEHHTVIPVDQLRTQAGALARHFGLPGLPTQLPGDCATEDLERAACIRAFLGRPLLVVLEHPTAFADAQLLTPLIAAIQQVRRRNGAVIWFTEHAAQAKDDSVPADRRYQVVGARLMEIG